MLIGESFLQKQFLGIGITKAVNLVHKFSRNWITIHWQCIIPCCDDYYHDFSLENNT